MSERGLWWGVGVFREGRWNGRYGVESLSMDVEVRRCVENCIGIIRDGMRM
jgi:hypothetical protein